MRYESQIHKVTLHTAVVCLPRYVHSQTNKSLCEKRIIVKSVPNIIVIHLKRFDWSDGGIMKMNDKIEIDWYVCHK